MVWRQIRQIHGSRYDSAPDFRRRGSDTFLICASFRTDFMTQKYERVGINQRDLSYEAHNLQLKLCKLNPLSINWKPCCWICLQSHPVDTSRVKFHEVMRWHPHMILNQVIVYKVIPLWQTVKPFIKIKNVWICEWFYYMYKTSIRQWALITAFKMVKQS